MEQPFVDIPPLKSALFVDFDNIYIGLSKTDPRAAERFASDPARWLAWLEKGLPQLPGKEGILRPRSVLIRRCYPNPDAGFRRFRSYFTSAAFSVIDCPSLTRTGKNSSDIYMVMDILDTLDHKTIFDEFIIFSGDSDFMPVLLRLRAHDRRTTTLSIDFMPPAYKAACDLVIGEEEFIENALGVSEEASSGNGQSRASVSMNLLKEMVSRVYQVAIRDGEVDGADLPDILKDFREFRDSNNWLGFGTSQRLADAFVCSEPRLQLVRLNATMYKIILKRPAERAEKSRRRGAEVDSSTPAAYSDGQLLRQPEPSTNSGRVMEAGETAKFSKTELARLRSQVIILVKEMIADSPRPILLARVSQHVVSQLGSSVLESQWAGAGSFKRLLQSFDDLGLEITTRPEPGYIYDPKRHTLPGLPRGPETEAAEISGPQGGVSGPEEGEELYQPQKSLAEVEEYLLEELPDEYEQEDEEEDGGYSEPVPNLEEFIRRVSRVTGAPDLTTSQYSLVFRGIVHELQQISAGDKSYSTYQSSKAVSEWCAAHGETIPRGDVVLIFKGIIFQDGVRFGKRPGSYTERELAVVVLNNIHALCKRARLELSDFEEHLLEEWILGEEGANDEEQYLASNGPVEPSASPAPETQQGEETLDE